MTDEGPRMEWNLDSGVTLNDWLAAEGVQVEDPRGAAAADEIAAMPGVDMLWLGHNDLSVALGEPSAFDHPDFVQAEQATIAAHLVRERIELEILETKQPLIALPARASQQRAQTRNQLLARERLGEIVVRAGLEARHPV